ncbi:MAG: acetyl-CoA carboxylase carboxyltransferase subunit beta [Elusimicrobia bacterium]|nr:acetyl-CoA carboxylase carboxyltransferase subunit beta [Elusimicrobiota bacterium]
MAKKKDIPEGLFERCPKCGFSVYGKELEENLWVCPKCNYYHRLSSDKRLSTIIDENTFREYDRNITAADPLNFIDMMPYKDRIESYRDKTKLTEAIMSGVARIGGIEVCICVLDFTFMGGSMGAVVGEKVCRSIDRAIKLRSPLILISSSGGARMQEGILSLMQMAKTAAAIARLSNESLPYFSIMCDPTSGGVSASFAMIGDINISEPKTLIAFAGPRVIQQTIKQELPPGFQSAEFVLEHGMLDIVIEREDLRSTLIKLLKMFGKTYGKSSKKD